MTMTLDFGEVRQRREALLDAAKALEGALAAPASGPGWRNGLGDALSTLRETLVEHVTATEAPDGIINVVRRDAPRLASHADRLVADHGRLMADTEELLDRLGGAPADWTKTDVDDIRDRALELLHMIMRHRHRGSDLVYDAYNVDVGGTG